MVQNCHVFLYKDRVPKPYLQGKSFLSRNRANKEEERTKQEEEKYTPFWRKQLSLLPVESFLKMNTYPREREEELPAADSMVEIRINVFQFYGASVSFLVSNTVPWHYLFFSSFTYPRAVEAGPVKEDTLRQSHHRQSTIKSNLLRYLYNIDNSQDRR